MATTDKGSFAAIRKRYSLPDMELLSAQFDLPDLSKEQHPLREVVKKIAERLDWAAQNLEAIMQPEHFAGMQEVDSIPEKTKEDALVLYRELMFLFRECQLQMLDFDEAKNAAFIKDLSAHWQDIRSRLTGIISLLRDTWKAPTHALRKKQSQDRGQAGYFG